MKVDQLAVDDFRENPHLRIDSLDADALLALARQALIDDKNVGAIDRRQRRATALVRRDAAPQAVTVMELDDAAA